LHWRLTSGAHCWAAPVKLFQKLLRAATQEPVLKSLLHWFLQRFLAFLQSALAVFLSFLHWALQARLALPLLPLQAVSQLRFWDLAALLQADFSALHWLRHWRYSRQPWRIWL
jgi:hypothetical protein